ncbi:MAG: hypothetical protein CMJ40_11930 [Phycisphaerae bacterium]|nr:hypothetical protein [Phycisphaerae bacterium]|tara:strand:- start:37525 stop:38100 length:576 start_codon:yes stop_codon:yes gene_type:complete
MTGRYLLSITTWGTTALWIASMLSAAAAAIGVFSVLPELGPVLPEYGGIDPASHGRLAAGLVTEPIFTATDMAQVLLSTVLVASVCIHWWKCVGADHPIARWTWTGTVLLAAGCFWYRMLLVMPDLNLAMQRYHAAARSGDAAETALAFKAFDVMHPVASTLMESTLILVLLGLGALAVLYTHRTPREPTR